MDMFSEYRRRMEQFVKQKLKTLGLGEARGCTCFFPV